MHKRDVRAATLDPNRFLPSRSLTTAPEPSTLMLLASGIADLQDSFVANRLRNNLTIEGIVVMRRQIEKENASVPERIALPARLSQRVMR